MSTSIIGMGTAVPAHPITRQEAAEAAQQFATMDATQARLIPVLYRKSGVDRRFLCMLESDAGDPVQRQTLFQPARDEQDRGPTTAQRMERYAQYAPALAHQASRQALTVSATAPAAITHLITVSCSGFSAPGFDLALIDSLGLSPMIARTHVGFMGCHGAMNALRVAHAFTASDANARVLLCATELCSLHFRYGWDPDAIITNALFADGAAALVLVPKAADAVWRLRASGSLLMPDSADAMTWRIRDHGFEMSLSARVPELIGSHLRTWLSGWLHGHGLELADVASWAVHPGGPRILQAVTETLGLPAHALNESRDILARYGNMSSPTVLFVLDQLAKQASPRPCVALGFGPGLVVEAMLLD